MPAKIDPDKPADPTEEKQSEPAPPVKPVASVDEDQTPIKRGAPEKDNPYAPLVASAKEDGKVRRLTMFQTEANLKSAVGNVRKAATAVDRTALVEMLPPAADGTFGFRFQLVSKITRKRKAKGDAQPADTVAPSSSNDALTAVEPGTTAERTSDPAA